MDNDLKRTVDALPGLAWTARPDGHVELLNQRWLEYAGLCLQEASGWGWQSAVHPDDLPGLLDRWRTILASSEPGEMEARLRGRVGEYRWFLISANPLRDEAGKVVRWYGLNTDIEGRKQLEATLRPGEPNSQRVVRPVPGPAAEATKWSGKRTDEALQASERNLVQIINTIPTTAWSTRPDGYCDFLSDRWLDYAGFTMEEAIGWNWGAAIHPDDVKGLVDYWQGCLASGTPVDTEARMRRFDGEYRWFLFRANPLRDDTGAIVKWYGTNVDIEDRKKADEALRASERNLSLIINTIPMLAWSTRPDGFCDFLNQRWLEYAGMSAEQARGWAWARPFTLTT